MIIYCGVDFHARMQTVAYCDSQLGEIHILDLHHQTDDLRGFYAGLNGDVIVGLEASGYSPSIEYFFGIGGRKKSLKSTLRIDLCLVGIGFSP